MSALKEKYVKTVAPALKEEFNLSSVMQIPKIEKIVINKGVGEAARDAKLLEVAAAELEAITGQRPVLTRAKRSIATYKVREGQPIGCKVTLRGEKMWAFIETLFNVALPRVRDFKGISSRGFDQHGNYTLGIKEQIIFPQIVYDNVKKVSGFDVTFVMSSEDNNQSYKLLKMLGAPFTKTRGDK